MNKFIELTQGVRKITINISHIVAIDHTPANTAIILSTGVKIVVVEKPVEIVHLINS